MIAFLFHRRRDPLRKCCLCAAVWWLIAMAGAGAAEEPLEGSPDARLPVQITRVAVGEREIRVEGHGGNADDSWFLAEIPMEKLADDPSRFERLHRLAPAEDGSFAVDLPRQRDRYDRFSCRWQIVRKAGGTVEELSHARYADQIACRRPSLSPGVPATKKGLGGWNSHTLPGELEELGIASVTVNVLLHALVSLGEELDSFAFSWQGRTYYARNQALAALDETFLAAAKSGATVSAILLAANPARDKSETTRLLAHPDATEEGIFAMPNVTSEEGIALYGAVLHLMAERWTREEGTYGRVHHWIMHNEVDAGAVWTNAGAKTDLAYMDLYQRSLRLMALIARQYDPHAHAFVSLTHHWAERGEERWYGSKRMLELLVRCEQAEGPFPWGLAYHPYPQDLFNPRTWEDEQATFTFDTPKITPKNLEVLDAFMKLPAMRYQGRGRPVHLSENGFHSRDYSEEALAEQAAGMAFAWKKIAGLSSLQAWQYHNWIDNRHEGGLRIGLRKFRDDAEDPYGKKPIWRVYQALGTEEEESVLAPYLKVIGIDRWDEILHREPIR